MIEPVKELNKAINADLNLAPPIDPALASCKKNANNYFISAISAYFLRREGYRGKYFYF